MPSTADDCWRLSADCSHWATESRDNAARLAFRQMATAWAGLAFSQDFVSATHEPVDLTSSESSQVAPADVPVSNPEVNAERPEQTSRASTSEQRLIPLALPAHEPADLTSSESSQVAPAENIASSNAENEEIVPVSNPEVNEERPEQTTRASTSEQRFIPFTLPAREPVDLTSSESSQVAPAENIASSNAENEEIVPVSNPEVSEERPQQTTRAATNNSSGQRERLSLPSPIPFPARRIVVDAAITDAHAVHDAVPYRRAALGDPPAHSSYVVTGPPSATLGNTDVCYREPVVY